MGTYMQIWIWLFDSDRLGCHRSKGGFSPPYEICHLLGVVYFQYGIYIFFLKMYKYVILHSFPLKLTGIH